MKKYELNIILHDTQTTPSLNLSSKL